jgi:hypothetical protein
MQRFRPTFAAVAAVALVAGAGVPSAGASSAGPSFPAHAVGAAQVLHDAATAGMVGAAGVVRAANVATVNQAGQAKDNNGNPVADRRAAVVSTSASYSPGGAGLTLTPGSWTDPLTDVNWQGFTFVEFDLWSVARPTSGAQSIGVVEAGVTSPTSGFVAFMGTLQSDGTVKFRTCPGISGNPGEASHVYGVSIPASCFGSPRNLYWDASMLYDAFPSDQTGASAWHDIAPETLPLASVNPYDDTQGYWLFAGDGGVFTEGNARFFGSLGNVHLVQPIVAAAGAPFGKGYWLAAGDGGLFGFGGAGFHGSLGNLRLAQPIVAMAARPQGDGYWLFARDGGVFSFGKAAFHGSLGNVRLAQPIVSGFASSDGGGYILIAADGGVFAFGDAHFKGSLGNTRLNQPVVTGAATPNGKGYWLFARDGGVFTFGGAPFLGSTGNIRLAAPIVSASAAHGGYRMAAADGGVFTFGVPFEGSEGATALVRPIVTMATAD